MNVINKTNKYLLENYPLIWNTRLVWMISVNILVHLLFFIIGFSSANNLEDLKNNYSLNSFFFESSAIYYNFLISIFVVLVWIIFYLRNNAFKNTYCLKKGMLFKQFCIIFFIFFISTTQYFSFKKGLITKIKTLYSWDEVNKDIKTFNKVALFLVQNQSDYEIDKKKYPKPFPLNVAFTDSNILNENVDITKPFLEYKGSKFQFYEIDEELWNKNTENNNLLNEYNKYDFKYRIVKDVSEFKALLHPSLYNYSKTKFTTGQDSIEIKKLLNYYQDILEKADEFSIKEELKKGIYLAQKYQIKHNLNIPEWYQLINNQPNYLLKELINVNDPNLKDVNGFYYNNNYSNNNSTFDIGIPYSKKLFFNFNKIDDFFRNVYFSYYPTFEYILFNSLIIFSFFLGVLLFVFKTTNGKSLILSFVASLVVLVLIIWLMSSTRNLFEALSLRDYIEYFIMILISIIIIFLSILSYIKGWKKLIISIFWTLAIFAVPTFFLCIALFIIRYLNKINSLPYPNNYVNHFEQWFYIFGYWVILFICFLTVYLYAIFIRKLKAKPE